MVKSTVAKFKTKAKHSNTDFIDMHSEVEIICRKHGSFWMTPYNHLEGQGCPKCDEDLKI